MHIWVRLSKLGHPDAARIVNTVQCIVVSEVVLSDNHPHREHGLFGLLDDRNEDVADALRWSHSQAIKPPVHGDVISVEILASSIICVNYLRIRNHCLSRMLLTRGIVELLCFGARSLARGKFSSKVRGLDQRGIHSGVGIGHICEFNDIGKNQEAIVPDGDASISLNNTTSNYDYYMYTFS